MEVNAIIRNRRLIAIKRGSAESPSERIKRTIGRVSTKLTRVISVASFVTDIITPSRHRKVGRRTNSFRIDEELWFSRIR